MKLTLPERWILSNQHRILEILEPECSTEHLQAQQALIYGFEGEYSGITGGLRPPIDCSLSEDECTEVLGVLLMFRLLRQAAPKYNGSLAKIDVRFINFLGFDKRTEYLQIIYAEYLKRESPDLFSDFDDKAFESSKPQLPKYRAMLREWKSSNDAYNQVSYEDIVRITNAH